MHFTSIADCFEYIRTSGSYSDAVTDCINAYRQSEECLVELFDSNLFGTFDEKDRQYRDELARIEQILFQNDLIHTD